MKTDITLPSGETVTLKDPSELRVKDRKRIIKSSDGDEGQMSKALALGDAVIATMVKDWSFKLIIPSVKIESLDELTPADYDALQEACQEAQQFLFPSLGKTDENEADPKATTANSND
jgi:hypothetical protein